MNEYSRDDFHDCLGGRRVLFVGDSTSRQLFFAAAKRLDHEKADEKLLEVFVSENPQHDVSLEADGVRLEFMWDPWLNSSDLFAELEKFQHRVPGKQTGADSAGLIVLGAPGLWAARNGGDNFFSLFRRGVDPVRRYLRHDLRPERGRQLDYGQLRDQVLMTAVQVPWYARLSRRRAETLSPSRIDLMNGYLRALPHPERSHLVTVYGQMTRGIEQRAFEDTGIHINEDLAERWIDVVLNVRCNNGLQYHGQMDKKTCCVRYPSPVLSQAAAMCLFALAFCIVGARKQKRFRSSQQSAGVDGVGSLAAIGAVLAYCYAADRTHLFAKTEKHYSKETLILLWTGFAVFSLCTLSLGPRGGGTSAAKPRRPGAHVGGRDAQSADAGILSRSVTNEWKGLMLGCWLVFASCETSGVLWIYKITRIFGACFLFLSAYGHSTYFLRTDDLSLRRVAEVLLRLNGLACLASLVLRSSWLVYYFSWVLSFWFLTTYGTFRAFRHVNGDPLRLVGKLLGSATIVTVLVQQKWFLDIIGYLPQLLAGAAWPAEDARTLLASDRIIPYLGMLVAMLSHRVALLKRGRRGVAAEKQQPRLASAVDGVLSDIITPDPALAPLRPTMVTFAVVALTLSLFVSLAGFGGFFTYQLYHPFLSIVPVLCYAFLRSSHRVLRNSHLRLPSMLGRAALEVYILHHHVFLSGDGTGLLGSGYWVSKRGWVSAAGARLEMFALALVLIWASRAAHQATRTISAWIFGSRSTTDDDTQFVRADMDDEAEMGGGGGGLLGFGYEVDSTAAMLNERGKGSATAAPKMRDLLKGSWLGIFADARVRAGGLVFMWWIMNIL